MFVDFIFFFSTLFGEFVGGDKVANTCHELGVCVGEAGQHRRAAELVGRALSIREAKLSVDAAQVFRARHDRDRFAREAELDKKMGGWFVNVLGGLCRPCAV